MSRTVDGALPVGESPVPSPQLAGWHADGRPRGRGAAQHPHLLGRRRSTDAVGVGDRPDAGYARSAAGVEWGAGMRAEVTAGPGGRDARGVVAEVGAGAVDPSALVAEATRRCADAVGDAVVSVLEDPDSGASAGPLRGVGVGVKDLIAVAGVPTTLGLPAVAGPGPAPEDAEVVRRLRAAGAAIPATLALHPLAFGVTGRGVANPAAPDRLPGGSSSGSACGVASGLVHAAVGTDTGGGVRIPAACCGVVGLKPSLGAVSTRGVQPLAWSLDTVGLLAGSTDDLALLWPFVAGHDPDDPSSEPAEVTADGPTPRRVGRPRNLIDLGVHPEVLAVFDGVTAQLADRGVAIVDVDLPSLGRAHRANGDVLCAEAAAVWGERFEQGPADFGDEIGRRLRYGLDLSGVALANAWRFGRVLRAELRAARRDVDALVLPTLPCRVPRLDEHVVDVGLDDPMPVTPALTRFTNPWNLCGAPAGSVPGGHDSAGAPVGVQVVAGAGEEARVLAGMRLIEELAPAIPATRR